MAQRVCSGSASCRGGLFKATVSWLPLWFAKVHLHWMGMAARPEIKGMAARPE